MPTILVQNKIQYEDISLGPSFTQSNSTTQVEVPMLIIVPGGGGAQYRDVPPTWVAKSASWYKNDPL